MVAQENQSEVSYNMSFVPLMTERLHIRALTRSDLDGVHRILSDERTTQNVSWRQESREAASTWLDRRIRDEATRGMSMWALEHRLSGELIGLAGPFPRDESSIELGYVVHASHWGKGYASEAVYSIVDALTSAGHRLYATIRPSNEDSIRVASKSGFQFVRSYHDKRGEMCVYERAGKE